MKYVFKQCIDVVVTISLHIAVPARLGSSLWAIGVLDMAHWGLRHMPLSNQAARAVKSNQEAGSCAKRLQATEFYLCNAAVPAARKAQTLIMPGSVRHSIEQDESILESAAGKQAASSGSGALSGGSSAEGHALGSGSTSLGSGISNVDIDAASTVRMGKLLESQPIASRQHHHVSSSGR